MGLGAAERLRVFIIAMSSEEFRGCPKGTGLKTAIEARRLGLVEWTGNAPAWTFRLTKKGVAYRGELLGQSERARSNRHSRFQEVHDRRP